MNLWLPSGDPVRLGPALTGRTGEGAVHGVVGHPDLVAKVFHADLTGLATKLDKVAAMVASAPPGAVQPDGFVVLTWPQQVLVGPSGPVGYVMARIDTATAVELHTMSNPSDRTNPKPADPQWTRNATWGHLVNVAANLCLAVEVVHRVEAVIGDFQERNILVSDTTRVTLVDCDSMQFTSGSGERFLCPVGRPEFTAPELARLNLREHPREKTSDLFALAVHIHQLLLAGNHPFLRGDWTGGGEQPDALSLAIAGEWAGGPNSRLRTHPLAPSILFLPNDVQHLFVRAFTTGATDPAARPSAAEWRRALSQIRLTTCAAGAHHIPAGAVLCPWCAIDVERAARRTGSRPAARPYPSAPARPAAPALTGPRTAPRPAVPEPAPDTFFGMRSRTYLVALASVVVVVVALAVFIVWALLSGTASL
ncbi:hypothetical protein [Mycolicibacterium sp.]|uniref:hypothetical protein n=1 Tax=Mycolicibacterium sp. TaxID=2320850 RepID=UPI003D0BCC8B